MNRFEELKKSYSGKKVFVTGHTGFKGSWLVEYLNFLGATVKGYSKAPITEFSHFDILKNSSESVIADIMDLDRLTSEMESFQPDLVMHLAAQPLVRYSYRNPIENHQVNILGVAHIFEAVRKVKSVKAVLNVTTDKCYENKEWVWGYRESEALGGYDPYSASKACSEILTSSYRNSYFNLDKYDDEHQVLIASARAGNVIGGGDWSEDRLIPDIIRAITSKTELQVRYPYATRPWQHVLEPLTGYILLAEKLLAGDKKFADAWNFGPSYDGMLTVEELVKDSKSVWDDFSYKITPDETFHEAGLLKLDSSKANDLLNWRGTWDYHTSIKNTIGWYKAFHADNKVLTQSQLKDFINAFFNA